MTARKGLLIQIILFLVCIPIAWNIVTHASSVQDSVNKIDAKGTVKEIVGDEFNREDVSARLHNPDMNFLLKVLVVIFAIGTKHYFDNHCRVSKFWYFGPSIDTWDDHDGILYSIYARCDRLLDHLSNCKYHNGDFR